MIHVSRGAGNINIANPSERFLQFFQAVKNRCPFQKSQSSMAIPPTTNRSSPHKKADLQMQVCQ